MRTILHDVPEEYIENHIPILSAQIKNQCWKGNQLLWVTESSPMDWLHVLFISTSLVILFTWIVGTPEKTISFASKDHTLSHDISISLHHRQNDWEQNQTRYPVIKTG
jgi:hypothetical protein